MAISIVKKTKGNITLTKKVTKILNEWQLDFNSAMKFSPDYTKQFSLQEREIFREILKLKKLNCVHIYELYRIVDNNFSIFNSLSDKIDKMDLSFEMIDFISLGIRIGLESLVIKSFIDKNFKVEFLG